MQVNHRIIALGNLTQANCRISAVAAGSFVDSEDATFTAALTAAVKHHDVLEIYDSAKRKIGGAVGAIGTGETLGSDAFGTFDLTNGFTSSNATINDSNTFTTTAINGYVTKAIVQNGSGLYKGSFVASETTGVTSFRNTVTTVIADGDINKYYTALSGNVRIYNTVSGAVVDITTMMAQQVLTPSTGGATIFTLPGGATQSWSVKDTAFNYNDTSGYTWRIVSSAANGRTVYSNAITSSAIHASMVAGAAFFFHDTIDFSTYAVSGTQKYLIALYDSSNRVAWGYAKAAGGGEAAATDVLAGWNFTNGWTASAGATINDANTFTTTGSTFIYKNANPFTVGQLLKITFDSTQTAGTPDMRHNAGTAIVSDGATNSYFTALAVSLWVRSGVAATVDVNTMTAFAVTAPPVTGLTITSTPDGATYDWTAITTGFNANAITSAKIWRVY